MLPLLPSFNAAPKTDTPAATPWRSTGQPADTGFATLVRQHGERQLDAQRRADQQALAARVSAAASLVPRWTAAQPTQAVATPVAQAGNPSSTAPGTGPSTSGGSSRSSSQDDDAATAPPAAQATPPATAPRSAAVARPKPAQATRPDAPRHSPTRTDKPEAIAGKPVGQQAAAPDVDGPAEAGAAAPTAIASPAQALPHDALALASLGSATALPAPQPVDGAAAPDPSLIDPALAAAGGLPVEAEARLTTGDDTSGDDPAGLLAGRSPGIAGPAAQARTALADGATPAVASASAAPARPDAVGRAERQVGEAVRQRALGRSSANSDDAVALGASGLLPGAPQRPDAQPERITDTVAASERQPRSATEPTARRAAAPTADGAVALAGDGAAALAGQPLSGGQLVSSTATRTPSAPDSATTGAALAPGAGAALSLPTPGATAAEAAPAPGGFDAVLQGALASAGPARGLSDLAGLAGADATVSAVPIDTPVDSPMFASALGAQVSLLARDGVTSALLQLHPLEMGPISVEIALDGNAARVDFQALRADTRGVIEASLPALAGALQDAGLTLAGGGVFDQAQGRQPQGQAEPGRPARPAAPGEGPAPAAAARRPAAPRGLVDLIA